MGKLIVTEFITLDGVVEAPGGEPSHPHSGWVFDFSSPEQDRYKLDETLEAESHLLGRVTYESFAGAWPKRKGPFADHINSMKKYVASSTLPDPLEWENSTLIQGDVATEIAKVKERDEGPILVAGSCTLVHTLLENDLVDEVKLMVFPTIIGGGKRPFPESGKKKDFKLVDSQTFATGVTANSYQPA
ncbi:MAG TPA: dihydrofolate reductase family protein [Solirubrobacterales bacterium]|nr:dihydrofolate reductase family protein [Solirubrobacterales bacterium]